MPLQDAPRQQFMPMHCHLQFVPEPTSFVVPAGRQKLAAGRVTFIRRVSPAGAVTVLSQSFRAGKRHRGLYLRLVIDTGRGRLTAYLNGRVLKRWPYKLLND